MANMSSEIMEYYWANNKTLPKSIEFLKIIDIKNNLSFNYEYAYLKDANRYDFYGFRLSTEDDDNKSQVKNSYIVKIPQKYLIKYYFFKCLSTKSANK